MDSSMVSLSGANGYLLCIVGYLRSTSAMNPSSASSARSLMLSLLIYD